MAALLITGACAGSDGVSRSDFIGKADEICAGVNEEINELGQPKDLKEAARFAGQTARLFRSRLADLRELEVPEGDEDAVDAVFDQLDEAEDLATELAGAANNADEEAIGRIGAEIQQVQADADAAARRYGFKECGVDRTPPS